MSDATKGGFNIGSVGGNVSVSAGGDVVAGDKVTTTTSTTTCLLYTSPSPRDLSTSRMPSSA